MTNGLTPDQLQSILDDLARLSLRHGITISGLKGKPFEITASSAPVGGYAAEQTPVGLRAAAYPAGQRQASVAPHYVSSLDVSELSGHERLGIMGGQG